jgi:hypothetical protein
MISAASRLLQSLPVSLRFLYFMSWLTCAVSTACLAQAQSMLSVNIDVELPNALPGQCSGQSVFPPDGGPAQITDGYGVLGVSTHVPSGNGVMAQNIVVSNSESYELAREVLAVSNMIFRKPQGKTPPSYCTATYRITLPKIPYSGNANPAFTMGGITYDLLSNSKPLSGPNPNIKCELLGGGETCTINLPLNPSGMTPQQMNYLYTDAQSLLSLSQKIYCEGAAGNNPCN